VIAELLRRRGGGCSTLDEIGHFTIMQALWSADAVFSSMLLSCLVQVPFLLPALDRQRIVASDALFLFEFRVGTTCAFTSSNL